MNKNFIISAMLVLLCSQVAWAQSSISPYSRTAYGFLSDNVSSIQRSMGGVGYAMPGGRIVNAMNPASYAHVDSLTFLWDIGVDFTNLWSEEDGVKGYSFGGGLDYITSQFRITKGLGGSFGLVPYSSVGYSFGSKLDNGSESRSGSGGINQLYIGAGYQLPIKGLSVGLNVSYLFGTLTNTTLVTASSTSYFTRNIKIRDWNMQLGLQYNLLINQRDRLTVGMTVQPKKSFHGNAWGTIYDSQDADVDTVGYTSMKGLYEQPASIGVGVSYLFDRRLMAEIDYTYQQWSKAKYQQISGFEPDYMTFDDRWKLAAGISYTPNRRGSYLGAMQYRVGAFYNHDYMNVLGNNVRDYGLSAGVGLPVPNGKTTVNLGIEWRHRQSSPVHLITENYFNITLGVNFNELWFWKNRIR